MEKERKEIIRIENLNKFYKLGEQQVKALDGVCVSIFKNEYVAIMGPSGSGKSTLMNILGCLDTPTGGKYILNGTDVSQMEDNQLAQVRNKEIGFVFQSFNLLPRYTSLENVALPLIYSGVPRSKREERAKNALCAVGLGERMEHKPAELSGGQRQRVATGNLDTKTSIEIMKLFEEIYKKGNTVVIVTHEEDIALHARRIIRLRDGKIESDSANPNPAIQI